MKSRHVRVGEMVGNKNPLPTRQEYEITPCACKGNGGQQKHVTHPTRKIIYFLDRPHSLIHKSTTLSVAIPAPDIVQS